MPPKRKAVYSSNDSPAKRKALTSTNSLACDVPAHPKDPPTDAALTTTPKVRRTYGRSTAKAQAGSPEAENTTLASIPPQELDFSVSSTSPKTRRHRRQADTRETTLKRQLKNLKVDQGGEPTPLEAPRKSKRTPKAKLVVEIPPQTRIHRLASPPSSPPSSPPPVEPPSSPSIRQRNKNSHKPLASPLNGQALLSSKQLPLQFHPCLNAQKKAILRVLHNHEDLFATDQEEDIDKTTKKQLSELLNGTITRSEGNSCLLLGPRGSGKSRILDRCLKSLPETPIIIRLSGWIHHSDRLAMREIAYQLSRQTGQSFLPADEDQDDNPFLDHQETVDIGLSLPPPSQLPALISVIPTLSRPTIVILDAFDLFALHPRQALLYCLLDTVQSCRIGAENKGLAVIGVTARVDTINLLEKRVKSRFSGRVVHATGITTTKDWLSLVKKALCPDIPMAIADAITQRKWSESWKKRISELLDDKSIAEAIKDTIGLTKDPKLLFRILVYVVTRLSPASPFPSASLFLQAILTQRSRPSLYDSLDLPYPSLCLLIASLHALTAGHDIFTFEMLFSNFRSQIRALVAAPVQVNGGSIGMVRCSKAVLLSAFDHLIACHIFVPTAPSSSLTAKEFTRYRTNLEREEVKRIIEKTGQVTLKKWLSKAE